MMFVPYPHRERMTTGHGTVSQGSKVTPSSRGTAMQDFPPDDDLADDERRLLAGWENLFKGTWSDRRLDELYQLLPSRPHRLRKPLLLRLLRSDMTHRKVINQRVTLAEYLERLPELRECPDIMLELSCLELRLWPHDTPTSAAEPGKLPAKFGQYELIRELGTGAMGTVYLYRDTKLDVDVVLKVPRLDPDDGPKCLERLREEARAAAQLSHRNICKLYDIGEYNGITYLKMAYVEGQTLDQALPRGDQLPQAVARALVVKLALALHQAHTQGVIHRGLKPTNIILDKHGEPVILDFGLARRIDKPSAKQTEPGLTLGTLAYMPPEQVLGDARQIGPTSDVYSLGVILYELLTGRLPFPGGEPISVMWRVLNEEPIRPSHFRADLHPQLEKVCLRALAKRGEDRYPSMAAFAEALSEISLEAQPLPPPGWPWQKLLRATFAVALGCLLLGGFWALLSGRINSSSQRQSLSQEKTLDWLPDPAQDLKGHDGLVLALALSPGGDQAVTGDINGNVRVWQLDPPQQTAMFAEHKGQRVRAVAWSLEGKRIVSADDAGRVTVWCLDAEQRWQLVKRLPSVSTGLVDLTLSPDGLHLVAVGKDRRLYWGIINGVDALRRVDAEVGLPQRVCFYAREHYMTCGLDGKLRFFKLAPQPQNAPHHPAGCLDTEALAVSADGRWAVTGSQDRLVRVWDLTAERMEPKSLSGHEAAITAVTVSLDSKWVASGDFAGRVCIWDLTELQIVGQFQQRNPIHAVVLLPGGKAALTAGEANAVRCWRSPD